MRTTNKGSTPGLTQHSQSPTADLEALETERPPLQPSTPNRHGRTPSPDHCVKASHQVERDVQVSPSSRSDEDDTIYPEGGLQAWLVVFGSWGGMAVAFGYVNTIGTFNAYLGQHQLRDYDASTISWIFSVFVFLVFFCGLQIGPVFDARGPRALVAAGSACLLVAIFTLGLCTLYWQLMLNFVLSGIGASLIVTPAVAAIAHWFSARRGTAAGIAITGGSCGGVIFPLMLQALFPRLGWAWSTRCLGFVFLVLLVPANLLIRSRLPTRKASVRELMPDARIFLDGTGALALTTMGIFFLEWGLFTPVSYLTTYALASGISPAYSYQLLAILNAGSVFGRWLPGYVSDRLGRFNTMLATVTLCVVSTLALWLPARGGIGLTTAYAAVFGFASGSNISLTPICVGQLCETRSFGRYYASCYTLVSFSSLTGLPIAGALVKAAGGQYWGLIVFTGVCYVAALACFTAVRVMRCGWDPRVVW